MTSETMPVLETGWDPNTPDDDTILRHGLLALTATWEATGNLDGGRIHRDERVSAVDLGRPTGMSNSASLLQPLRGDAFATTVARIERFYDEQGTGAALLWCPWPTPDLTDRGWTLQGHPPLLYRPAGLHVEPREPPDLAIAEVTTESELAAWCTAVVASFPLTEVDAPNALFDPAVLDDDRYRFIIGCVGGRTVAVGCQVVIGGTNVLLLSAVRPEARGHGYYAALVADRLTRASDLPAVTIVSDDSRPILVGRFDFLPVTRFTLWERQRP